MNFLQFSYFAFCFVWIEDFLDFFVRSFYRLPLDDFMILMISLSTETGQDFQLVTYA